MRCFITTVSFLLVFSATILAAPIYTWVDAQGVTHFAAEPPIKQKVKSIHIQTFQPKLSEKTAKQIAKEDAQTSDKTQAKIDREVRKQIAEETAALNTYCNNIRYNLAQLENNPRVLAEVNGRPTRLSEEQRQVRISELKHAISERCAIVKSSTTSR